MMKKFYCLLTAITLNLFLTFSQKSNDEYKNHKDILYRDQKSAKADDYINSQCRLDVYYPVSKKNFVTVVWFHGGGLEAGNRYLPSELMNQSIAVVSVSYRLSPKVSSPVYIDDAAAAVAWVFHNISKYGGDTNRIYISGHSAGGYLTSMIGLDKQYLAKYGVDANQIAGLIPLSGHAVTHFTIRKERGIESSRPIVDSMAPLYHVRHDAPPYIIISGDRELEMMGRYEENAYMARMMKNAKHKNTLLYELDGFDHGAMVSPGLLLLVKYIQTIQSANK